MCPPLTPVHAVDHFLPADIRAQRVLQRLYFGQQPLLQADGHLLAALKISNHWLIGTNVSPS